MNELLVTSAFLFISFLILLSRHIKGQSSDIKEPPSLPLYLPTISNVLGLIKWRSNYYTHLWEKYGLPIYAISLFGQKFYVASDPDVIRAVHRESKYMFWAMTLEATIRVGDLSPRMATLLRQNMPPMEGQHALFVDGISFYHKGLLPGEDLSRLTQQSIAELEKCFAEFNKTEDTVTDLSDLIFVHMTVAVTNVFYGPHNPLRDASVRNAFWTFSHHIHDFHTLPLPRYTAPKIYKARETLFEAFRFYFSSGGAENAAPLIRNRYQLMSSYGLCVDELAHFEPPNLQAILSNLVPTAFWAVWHALADTDISHSIRNQLGSSSTAIRIGSTATSLPSATDTPLLHAVTYEAMRYRTSGFGARLVIEDMPFDHGKYLLKKGALLLMPNKTIHRNASVWSDPEVFDPQRFLETPVKWHGGVQEPKLSKITPGAFRAFGGGGNHCPGRSYSMHIISAMVILLVVDFDVKLLQKQGEQLECRQNFGSAVVGIPKQKVMARIKRRVS